jgi:hypothetical protein
MSQQILEWEDYEPGKWIEDGQIYLADSASGFVVVQGVVYDTDSAVFELAYGGDEVSYDDIPHRIAKLEAN